MITNTKIKFVYGSAGVVLTANVTKRTKKAYFVAIEKLHGTVSEDKVLKRISPTTVLVEFRVPNDRVLKERTEESRMDTSPSTHRISSSPFWSAL